MATVTKTKEKETYNLVDLITLVVKTSETEKLISLKKYDKDSDSLGLIKSISEFEKLISEIDVLDKYDLINTARLDFYDYGSSYYTHSEKVMAEIRNQNSLVDRLKISEKTDKLYKAIGNIFLKNNKIPEDTLLSTFENIYKIYTRDFTYKDYEIVYYYKRIVKSSNDTFPNLIKSLNKVKRVSLSSIKTLAEDLGFIILPAKYLSSVAYDLDNSASNIIKKFKENLDLTCPSHKDYVLCPIIYLDLLKVAEESKNYSRIWFSKKLNTISTTLNMSIPVFRTMFARIRTLENKSAEHDRSLKECKDNISLINTQLQEINSTINETIINLSNKVNTLERTTAALNSKVNEQDKKIQELWRCLMDPLYFSIDGIDNIYDAPDNTTCYIGHCWGPEFPKDIINMFNN